MDKGKRQNLKTPVSVERGMGAVFVLLTVPGIFISVKFIPRGVAYAVAILCGMAAVWMMLKVLYDIFRRHRIIKAAYLAEDVEEAAREILLQHPEYAPANLQEWLHAEHSVEISRLGADYWWQQLYPHPHSPDPYWPQPGQALQRNISPREVTVLPNESTEVSEPAIENVDRPATVAEYFYFILFYTLMLAMFSVFAFIAASILKLFLPQWAAIMLALPIGVICMLFFCMEEGSMGILTVKLVIYLILSAILFTEVLPVFVRARNNARRQQHTATPAPAQGASGGIGTDGGIGTGL